MILPPVGGSLSAAQASPRHDKIATAFLVAAGALVIVILYIVVAPIPGEIGAENLKTAECIEQSGVSKDRD